MSKKQVSKSEQLLKELLTHPVKAYLKSERVQDPEQLQKDLQVAPGWQLGVDPGAIHRVKEFASYAQAGVFAGYAGNLAAAMYQPVTLALAGKLVGITLTGHPIVGCTGGLNKTVFRLAAMLG
ncbi:MAG TPA: 4a-hydroxytetrahydrobiopterin dehydratase [Thermoanaerobaculia bacterium]|nr:4a-hydroxytetrahydrobiopterin dehydratase [Thermoanaerobaculia bacterium]